MKERFEYLFLLYLESKTSEKELEEFLSYVEKSKYDQQLRDLIHQVYKEISGQKQAPVSYIDETGNLILNTLADPLPASPFHDEASRIDPASIESSSAEQSPVTPIAKKRLHIPILATCFLFLVLLTWWLHETRAKDHSGLTAARTLTKKFTEKAEYKYLLLPDSTQVWLNANSSLEYPDDLTDKKREVFLTGEAYFDVRHAEDRPFIIHTGKIITTVLGTAFNIKAWPFSKNVQVTVSKGKVKVSRNEQMIAILQKGQQIKIGETDTAIHRRSIDPEKISTWQKGTISYDDEPIGEIVQDLEQVYNLEIRVKDPSLLDTKITTSFDRNVGVAQAVKIISRLVDKQVLYKDGAYMIE